jgi:hypothetical protein
MAQTMRMLLLGWLAFSLIATSAASGADPDDPWGLRRAPNGGWSIYDDGLLEIQPTLTMQLAGFWQRNPWWGASRELLGDNADRWGEGSIETGVTVTRSLGSAGSLEGRYSYLGVWTRGGIDATGENFPDKTAESGLVEDLYLKWRSGDLLPGLGEDALELSFGRQDYQVGSGFIFWLGGVSGGSRGGYWLAARSAFRHTAIARLQTGALRTEAVYLSPNDSPNTHTRIVGVNFDYDLGKRGALGLAYFNIYDSDIRLRDGLSVFDARFNVTPFPALPGLSLAGEYVYQQNSDRLRAFGYYAEAAYELGECRWSPLAGYRFAFFSGDTGERSTNRAFDPLFYGMSDWGTWYQGEIFGEYVVLNQNLMTHRLRLRLEPSKAVTVNLIYYHMRLDERPTEIAARSEPRLAAVRSKHLGDEIDLTVDWSARDWLSLTAVAAVAFPGDAAEEFVGDDADWASLMLLAVVQF